MDAYLNRLNIDIFRVMFKRMCLPELASGT